MFPPSNPQTGGPNLTLEALSGISGSISIACWVVVFSPQIIENFRRSSAEGLSVVFIIIWLIGDIFNILGGLLQGILPTMIILAVYYTVADIVLLGQVWWYRGFTFSDSPADGKQSPRTRGQGEHDNQQVNGETRPLLHGGDESHGNTTPRRSFEERHRRSSLSGEIRRHLSTAGEHLSPATPLLDASRDPPAIANNRPTSTLQSFVLNTVAILLVCAAGTFGWWISQRASKRHHHHVEKDPEPEVLEFDLWGQIFGYFCAVLYLGSRVPQLLVNYRRKSTEGLSLLFFLFACLGNLSYDMSIFAYNPENACRVPGECQPGEAGRVYARYIAVNASWIVGSMGTLFLDMAIFVQFFLYKKDDDDEYTRTNGEVAVAD